MAQCKCCKARTKIYGYDEDGAILCQVCIRNECRPCKGVSNHYDYVWIAFSSDGKLSTASCPTCGHAESYS